MNKKITARALALMLAAMMAVGTGSAFADSADTAAEATAEVTEAAEATDAPAEVEATAKPEVASNIVATVGDVEITAEETADLYSYVLEMYSYYGYDTTDSETVAQLKDITLDAMVSAKAQEIMEAEMGLDQFTDEELAQFQSDAQATYDETYQSVYEGFDDGETSEDDLKAQTEAELNKYGYTVEALVEQAKAEAAYNKLYEALTKDVTVTDDDVKEEYAATVASDKEAYESDLDGYSLQSMYGERPAYTPEGIRTVKHILVKFTDEDSQKISELEALSEKPDDYDEQYQALIDAAYANIKDKVDEIMAKIDAGEDFDALVEEYEEVEPGHRHMSHLFGLFPGSDIATESTPELVAACRRTMELRLASGGGHTGWSRAWLIALTARMRDGDLARGHVEKLITNSMYDNMFDRHPPFQIDGNFGAAAGMIEMLIQSHQGFIDLLPALPAEWANGEAKGLCARGGYVMDMAWRGGKVVTAKITSVKNSDARIRINGEFKVVHVKAGEVVEVTE